MIFPLIGNIILLVLIFFHTQFIKSLLTYFGVYELSNYIMTQSFLEVVLLLISYLVLFKHKKKQFLFYSLYFLLHYSVFYLISMVSLYMIEPEGCMQIMFDLLKNPFLLITRIGITLINLYLIFRYSKYLSKQFIFFQYLILVVLIVLSLI